MIPVKNKRAIEGFQIRDGVVVACDGIGLKNILEAGQQWLKAHVNVVNGLNVFPVPDGDTGTNMVLTMRSAVAKATEAPGHDAGLIAQAAAEGALLGARGNSGVILSQFLQGLAQSLEGRATFTGRDLARASQVGVEQAYKSVVKPVEGTILTVARAAAEAAQRNAETNDDLVLLFAALVKAAKSAQANTPELLPVLKEAGVTDSGGQGLVYILEGGLRFMRNEPVDVDPAGETIPSLQSTLGADEEAYGYDVQFLIEGQHLDVDAIRAQIDRLGWSTVVVGDRRHVKVHVHTPDPSVPLNYGKSQGTISDIVVENMEEQARAFVYEHAAEALSTGPAGATLAAGESAQKATPIATVAVAPGRGLARIFQSLGVSQVVSGGQTMNPSTQDLLDAVNRVEAESVLILPNNRNIILAARQVEPLANKAVHVVPTKTVPQGITALLSFNFQADLETNARRMLEAAQQVETIEVTRAVRNQAFNGYNINPGDVIGLINNELMSVGHDYNEAVLDILAKIETEAYEIVTIYFGRACSPEQAKTLAARIEALYPELELEIHDGGQPHYHYIVSLE